jgi:DNA invertase Pin-like site-specific DNA recombinase
MDSNRKLKIALYARVSTLLNQDPENQLIHLRRMAEARGFEVFDEYVDKGISGAKERRPALDSMLADARAGQFQLIAIAALDRLGRNTKNILTLIDELKHVGVSIVSIREGIDFSSPVGQATLTIISAISQLERNLISERIKNALAAKKLAAQASGSNWRCGPKPTITQEQISKLSELRKQGVSIRASARLLGISKSSVQRILSDPKTSKNRKVKS